MKINIPVAVSALVLFGSGVAVYSSVSTGVTSPALAQESVKSIESSVTCDRPALTRVITPDGVSMQSEIDEGSIKVQKALLYYCKKAKAEGHTEGAFMSSKDFIAMGNFDRVMASKDNYWAIRKVIMSDGRELTFNEARAYYLNNQEVSEEQAEEILNSEYEFPTFKANGIIYVAPKHAQ